MSALTLVAILLALLARPALAAEVVLANVAPFSAQLASASRDFNLGLQVCVADINRNGGIGGASLRVVSRDDGQNPAETAQLVQELLGKEAPVVFIGAGSAPSIEVVMRADELAHVGAQLATMGLRQLGVLVRDDPAGQQALQTAREAFARHSVVVQATAKLAPKSLDLAPAVQAMQAQPLHAVVLLVDAPSAAAFVQRFRALNRSTLVVATSSSGAEALTALLGNDPKSIELLSAGKLDFTVSATGSYASLNPELNLAMLSYLVDTYEQGWALYDRSRWFAQAFGKLPARGVRVLASFEAGFRSFSARDTMTPLPKVRGLPMRVFKNEIIEAIVRALGFEPKVLGITGVYLALQSGTVFGQENPIDTIYSQRFFEVAPHLTLTQHVYSPIPLAVSQAIMTQSGAIVTRPDVRGYRQALQPVYGMAQQRYGASAQALLDETKQWRDTAARQP